MTRAPAVTSLLLALLLLASGGATAAPAQRAPLAIQFSQAASGPVETPQPAVLLGAVLSTAETRELVRGGFPAQLRFRLELYRESGWFYELERAASWFVIVAYDPASQLYRVSRRMGNQLEDLGGFATLSSAQEALQRPFVVDLSPTRRGRRYYYDLALDVEALSVSDLDQLQRWLRGELQPAVRGENNPATAIGNGMRTLFARVLGGERRHYEVRSARFRF